MIFCGKTDVGKRRANNQDCYAVTPLPDGACLLTVCDGMGGVNGGNVASEIACRVYTEAVVGGYDGEGNDTELMRTAVASANTAVYEAASSDEALKGMGTTLVSALVRADGSVTVVNVGDSRLYCLTDKELCQISRDHSYVQYLVDMGQITMKEAKNASIRNIIIRSVGNEAQTNPDFFTIAPAPGSYLLLCTDGLTNCVPNELLAETIHGDTEEELNACAERLISLANEGGGTDNITVILGKL